LFSGGNKRVSHRLLAPIFFVLVIREFALGWAKGELSLMAINRIITTILFTVVGNYDSILTVVRKANSLKSGDAKLWV